MALTFTRDTDVYVLYQSNYYKLHLSNIEFSQTFQQDGIEQKTLDAPQNLIERSSITKANPANFSITIPMVDESSVYQHILLKLLLTNTGSTLESFTLFIDPSTSDQPSNTRKMYQLSNCVLTSGSFQISRNALMKIEFNGQASQLTRVNHSAFNIGSYTSFENLTYAVSKVTSVFIDNNILENVFGVALEIQNDIEWIENNTLQNSLGITSYTQTTYPNAFVMTGRSVAGSISQYVGQAERSYANIQTWKENIEIRIKSGLAADNFQLNAHFTPCSFTNRVQPTEIYSQAYDYRLIGHPTNLNNSITYI